MNKTTRFESDGRLMEGMIWWGLKWSVHGGTPENLAPAPMTHQTTSNCGSPHIETSFLLLSSHRPLQRCVSMLQTERIASPPGVAPLSRIQISHVGNSENASTLTSLSPSPVMHRSASDGLASLDACSLTSEISEPWPAPCIPLGGRRCPRPSVSMGSRCEACWVNLSAIRGVSPLLGAT